MPNRTSAADRAAFTAVLAFWLAGVPACAPVAREPVPPSAGNVATPTPVGTSSASPPSTTSSSSAGLDCNSLPIDATAECRQCERGIGASCRTLGSMYFFGKGLPKDTIKAASLFTRGCTLHHGDSCMLLAASYCQGMGVPVNAAKSLEFATTGCAANSTRACELANALRAGRGNCAQQPTAQSQSTGSQTESKKTSSGSKQSCATGAEACAASTPYCCNTVGADSQPDGGGRCVATLGECETVLFACKDVAQCPSDKGVVPTGCGEDEAKKCTSAEPCTCILRLTHGDNSGVDEVAQEFMESTNCATPADCRRFCERDRKRNPKIRSNACDRLVDMANGQANARGSKNPSELCADDPDHNFNACAKACTDPNEPDYDACQLVCKKDNSKCIKGCERDGNLCRIACENGSETSCLDRCAAFLLTQSEMAMQNPCEGLKRQSVAPRMVQILKRELAAACKESRRTHNASPMRGFSIMLTNAKRNLPPSTIKSLNAEANACLGR